MDNRAHLKKAVEAALDGEWEVSHKIAQDYSDPIANWIHAVLHKIEGDVWNSKYWYAKSSGKIFEDFDDTQDELREILNTLS
jgi:hypothetical protein